MFHPDAPSVYRAYVFPQSGQAAVLLLTSESDV